MSIPNDFWISLARSDKYFNKSMFWLTNSWEFKYKSIDWQICRLKHKKYNNLFIKNVLKANKILNG